MRRIVASDFDGTITDRDSLLEFFAFVKGKRALYVCLLVHLPLLILMKMKLLDNGVTKQMLFSWFFKGMKESEFTDWCNLFALKRQYIIREGARDMIREAQNKGEEVIIVSASVDRWIQPFFPKVKVVGTQTEIVSGRLTGRFASPNCNGKEKVRRLKEILPERSTCYITAYGDSGGDKALFDYADRYHYKPFR